MNRQPPAAPSSLPRVLLACAALLAVLCLTSMLFGAGEVGPAQSLRTLFGSGNEEARFVVFGLRWLRTEQALLTGLALGAAGVLLQAVTRNPLTEPGLLEVSAGASFAVVLAINLGATAATLNLGVAVLRAMVGCMLVLLVTQMRGVGQDTVRLVLAGAAFSGILTALSSLMLLWDLRTADEMRFWIIGALAGRPEDTLDWTLPGLIAGLLARLPLIRPLAALALGERVASGLGHHPRLIRLGTLVVVALLVGTATAAAGPIGFVGLIVPFIARRLVGPDIRRTLGACLLLGPCVILLADILSRLLVRPYELPVGWSLPSSAHRS